MLWRREFICSRTRERVQSALLSRSGGGISLSAYKPSLSVASDRSPAQSPQRSLTWRSAFVVSLGSTLLVTVSLGPMASELGAASIVIWISTALVGFVQCLLIAELGCRFPDKLGGACVYCHEGLKDVSPVCGAVAAWSYWIGWIPGVAVNLLLAATYIKAAFWPAADVFKLTFVLVLLLYAFNYLGLKLSTWTSTAMALPALVPLLVILGLPLFRSSLWQNANFTPFLPEGRTWYSFGTLLLAAKWMFVAVWSSYGGEMVATMNGELRKPETDIRKAVTLAAITTTCAFAIVPTILVGTLGATKMGEDPYVVFLTATKGIFGGFGAALVSVMLIAALILGAQLFIISSSRALYQMSKDGVLIRGFSKINKFGVPVGSVRWDLLITISLLAIFKEKIVDVVAAANVGYLLVFILLPLAYVSVKRKQSQSVGIFTLAKFMNPSALIILVFNIMLFVIGGVQWGAKVMGVGILMVLTFIPFYLLRKREKQSSPISICP